MEGRGIVAVVSFLGGELVVLVKTLEEADWERFDERHC